MQSFGLDQDQRAQSGSSQWPLGSVVRASGHTFKQVKDGLGEYQLVQRYEYVGKGSGDWMKVEELQFETWCCTPWFCLKAGLLFVLLVACVGAAEVCFGPSLKDSPAENLVVPLNDSDQAIGIVLGSAPCLQSEDGSTGCEDNATSSSSTSVTTWTFTTSASSTTVTATVVATSTSTLVTDTFSATSRTSTTSLTTARTFSCLAESVQAIDRWPAERKRWCCRSVGVACAAVPARLPRLGGSRAPPQLSFADVGFSNLGDKGPDALESTHGRRGILYQNVTHVNGQGVDFMLRVVGEYLPAHASLNGRRGSLGRVTVGCGSRADLAIWFFKAGTTEALVLPELYLTLAHIRLGISREGVIAVKHLVRSYVSNDTQVNYTNLGDEVIFRTLGAKDSNVTNLAGLSQQQRSRAIMVYFRGASSVRFVFESPGPQRSGCGHALLLGGQMPQGAFAALL